MVDKKSKNVTQPFDVAVQVLRQLYDAHTARINELIHEQKYLADKTSRDWGAEIRNELMRFNSLVENFTTLDDIGASLMRDSVKSLGALVEDALNYREMLCKVDRQLTAESVNQEACGRVWDELVRRGAIVETKKIEEKKIDDDKKDENDPALVSFAMGPWSFGDAIVCALIGREKVSFGELYSQLFAWKVISKSEVESYEFIAEAILHNSKYINVWNEPVGVEDVRKRFCALTENGKMHFAQKLHMELFVELTGMKSLKFIPLVAQKLASRSDFLVAFAIDLHLEKGFTRDQLHEAMKKYGLDLPKKEYVVSPINQDRQLANTRFTHVGDSTLKSQNAKFVVSEYGLTKYQEILDQHFAVK
ncbi:hypothetical protein A2533_01770 [Candidatus Falkowbacteria bacterium RIFOXYD2_FULL_35_9]|uniref:Uncharacterized protein n=1 Tax=Candidatus Falkowbacteria bacterium RIFOXYC2_FULL_36_12 TaxID=1798002 RepID=A0A1F5T019_9BACT|nr:MAG: hypothetical protein A2300_00935 [Candidatus Falkowbacteria bacterium RIFOXYB2_FULL_35_7]OGF32269.1 MAG: hypothetical protein A2478_03005 [Candidatus Falkowbacteria bacterium RIFOXYC2_FULL_36_12]OGF33840.1 MAG: hypothetical protein A2223_00765 [Candidatus Falkowbacteria bacterium RIFOXYA2_FULL_35_8]OGF47965.1 MAG: hypothetical protein A2533_01770 [Candidatus Falkowbacteria bacterium RIFOXYD2_FULL_35_9]